MEYLGEDKRIDDSLGRLGPVDDRKGSLRGRTEVRAWTVREERTRDVVVEGPDGSG